MEDNRWCDSCGSDRGTKEVLWYEWEGTEVSFCRKCALDMRQGGFTLKYLPQNSDPM